LRYALAAIKLGHMMPETEPKSTSSSEDEPKRVLTPEAQRALAEAAERRAARDAAETARAKEIGGRSGPDPVRYGDWEQGGIAWDF
jgi:hypothetical protein